LTSGGLLGVWGKWVKHTKYIYNIQDFNPEQVLAVGYTKSKFITDAMMWFDKFSCKRSDLVITVGRDLVETVENRFKGKKVPKTVMINNWIDENEIYPLDESNERVVAFKKKYGLDGKFVIMYSGNIGLYYDLENLIKVVEKFKAGTKTADGREVVFAFVGAGSVLDKLVLYVKEHHMDNVTFIPYQDKADLIYSLNAGDLLRYAKPAAAQFGQVVRRGIFFRREQQQRSCQGVEHQHTALDWLRQNICHPAQAVFRRPSLAQYFGCIAGRRQNGLHMRFLYSWFISW